MNNITAGIIAGVCFGVVACVPMFFMEFSDKRAAITAAFINRFAIGFIIFNMSTPEIGWLRGLLVGLVLSLPAAIITKAWKPILGLGVIGGVVCGLLA